MKTGKDWCLKGVCGGEGLGKGWAPAKDSESFKILGKETSWIEFDHPYLKDLVNNDLIQEEEGFPALTCKLTGQRLSEGNLFCEDEGFRLRWAAMAM